MTIVGKILVFLNLVFSLVTAGLIVMVYTTRVNWNAAYNAQKAAATAAQTNLATVEANTADEIKKRDAAYQQLKAEKDRASGEARSLTDQLAKAKADYDALQNNIAKGTQNIGDLTSELNRRKTEVENLKKLVDDRDRRIADIDRQMANLRNESVQYRVQWEQSKERVAILQQQVEQLARDNERLRQQTGGGAAPSPSAGTGAPARIEDLRGTIKEVSGDLATITPGSDAGVAVGAELYVFRLEPKPEYLGKLTVSNVTPTQAVGRLSGPKIRQIKAGDEVAATLGGGR
jgi:predicted RNase H-like nuclease (RuvC/YqgF family)